MGMSSGRSRIRMRLMRHPIQHHQKLLDSLPKYYCPNPRCSALVQVDEGEEDPQAICPSCDSMVCIPCRVLWHDGEHRAVVFKGIHTE